VPVLWGGGSGGPGAGSPAEEDCSGCVPQKEDGACFTTQLR